MKWGLKGGISIDADSGPPRYVLWCCGGIYHQPDTFFKIGSGHTVRGSFTIFHHLALFCKNEAALEYTIFEMTPTNIKKKYVNWSQCKTSFAQVLIKIHEKSLK